MKQFGTIFQFELVNYLKNKVFAGITLFLVAAIAVIMFFPRLTGSNEEGGGAEEIVAGSLRTCGARPPCMIGAYRMCGTPM